jgi:hypothetical protein
MEHQIGRGNLDVCACRGDARVGLLLFVIIMHQSKTAESLGADKLSRWPLCSPPLYRNIFQSLDISH